MTIQKLKYDWVEIQRHYDAGFNAKECRAKFGFHKVAWAKAIKAGRIKARHRQMSLDKLLVADRATSSHYLKRRLLEAGLMQECCYNCDLTEWLGKPIALQIDHINGKNRDNRIENLRLLCPNCHSQTPTFGSHNPQWKETWNKNRNLRGVELDSTEVKSKQVACRG